MCIPGSRGRKLIDYSKLEGKKAAISSKAALNAVCNNHYHTSVIKILISVLAEKYKRVNIYKWSLINRPNLKKKFIYEPGDKLLSELVGKN